MDERGILQILQIKCMRTTVNSFHKTCLPFPKTWTFQLIAWILNCTWAGNWNNTAASVSNLPMRINWKSQGHCSTTMANDSSVTMFKFLYWNCTNHCSCHKFGFILVKTSNRWELKLIQLTNKNWWWTVDLVSLKAPTTQHVLGHTINSKTFKISDLKYLS